MIVVPAWVQSESESDFLVVLGSEPKNNAKKNLIPKYCVETCNYSPFSKKEENRFALFVLKPEKVPKSLKLILGMKQEN